MDFRSIAATLTASGYPPRKADAKIAHDIVLKAIEGAGGNHLPGAKDPEYLFATLQQPPAPIRGST